MTNNRVLLAKAAAFDQILAIVRAYLPPNSPMSKMQFVERVIGAVDNTEIAEALNEAR